MRKKEENRKFTMQGWPTFSCKVLGCMIAQFAAVIYMMGLYELKHSRYFYLSLLYIWHSGAIKYPCLCVVSFAFPGENKDFMLYFPGINSSWLLTMPVSSFVGTLDFILKARGLHMYFTKL